MFQSAQLKDSSKEVNFQSLKLEEIFVFQKPIFLNMLIKKEDIIWSAWSRCYLIQEKAYATL